MTGRPLIPSHIPGRLRLRSPELGSAARNAAAVATLAGWEGVLSAEGKPACNSIVLRYDPARLPPAEAEARLAALFPQSGDETAPATGTPGRGAWSLKTLNRPAKIGSMAALAGSLLALSVGKSLHAAFGIMHVAFLAVHLANHRKKILQ